MKKIFLYLFLVSCTSCGTNYNVKNEVFNFNDDLTFDEFNNLLIMYAESSPFPNIDE